VIAVKRLNYEAMFRDGRAVLQPEARSVHGQWWLDSAHLLDVDPGLDRPGMNVTPALLSTAVLAELHRRLEEISGRPWVEALLTSYCDWTEYTLYLLAAERAGLVNRHHIWADHPTAPGHLHLHPRFSVWDPSDTSSASVDLFFTANEPGLFAVAQSVAGLTTRDVITVASKHLPVRQHGGWLLPPSTPRSKMKEWAQIAARLVAQRIYRRRRRLPHYTRLTPAA
jgi:hypothetical protein